jgi:hypothetical protein
VAFNLRSNIQESSAEGKKGRGEALSMSISGEAKAEAGSWITVERIIERQRRRRKNFELYRCIAASIDLNSLLVPIRDYEPDPATSIAISSAELD